MHRGGLWKVLGSEQFLRGMWAHFTLKREGARKIQADAAQEKKGGKQGQWQQESPFKEVLEQVKRSADTDCGPQTMRRAYNAMKHGNWESFKEEYRMEGHLCEWTFERIREAYEKVAMDDIRRRSIAQDTLSKCTDFSRRIIAPVDGMGGSYVCPHCSCFPLDDYIWWVSTGHGDGNNGQKKHCNWWWCAPCGGQHPTGYWCSKRTQLRKGYLVNALKLLANQQTDGDSPIQSIVTGLQERSGRSIMDGLRSFIEIDNHGSVDVGHLRRAQGRFMSRSQISVKIIQRRPSGKEQMIQR